VTSKGFNVATIFFFSISWASLKRPHLILFYVCMYQNSTHTAEMNLILYRSSFYSVWFFSRRHCNDLYTTQ